MCEEKNTGTWLPIVKKTVDAIYDYLIQHPDGITMSGKEYGKRGARVCSKLVSRGIVEKKYLGRGNGLKYRWAATMAPTKVLYGSIAQELYDEDKAYKDTFYKKRAMKKSAAKKEEVAPVNPSDPSLVEIAQSIGTSEPAETEHGSIDAALSRFTIPEIWDYMKRNGVSVNGTLSYTTTTYLQ